MIPQSDESAGPGAARPRQGLSFGSIAALAGISVLWAIDFHFDVRSRDAFTWMDPYQYYGFALGVLEGREQLRAFEVPSLFPFFVMPLLAVRAGIPTALWIDLPAVLALAGAIVLLCRRLRIGTPAPVVAALALSSPLLIGLSRSLYVETLLAALVAFALHAWLGLRRDPSTRRAVLFGAIVVAGSMTKMTFPVFVAPFVAVSLWESLREGRTDHAFWLLQVSLLPWLAVLVIQMAVFPGSFGYYRNLGNTTLPIAHLIGPRSALSWDGATYMLAEIFETLLFLLSPFLALSVWRVWRELRVRAHGAGIEGLMLFAALLGPALIFIVPSVKEPRHMLPTLAPAMLLVAYGLDGVRRPVVRGLLSCLALALALGQYVATTARWMDVPYFMDQPLQLDALQEIMQDATPTAPYRDTPPLLRELHWKYNESLAIAGWSPNEALALTWWAFPGVVYDLDSFFEVQLDPDRMNPSAFFDRFEDPYLLAAFNTYNRRCGWRHYDRTLAFEKIVAHADFLLLGPAADPERLGALDEHEWLAELPRRDGVVSVWRRRNGPGRHYRTLHAESFLAHAGRLPPLEQRVIARSLLMTAVLENDVSAVVSLVRRFPVLRQQSGEDRNIYWIGGYAALIELADRRLQALLADGSVR